MNILIKNLSNTYNYGSMMMGENLITYLNQYSSNTINYYIEEATEEHISRLKQATEYENIFIAPKVLKKTSNNKILRYIYRKINDIKEINNYKKNYDIVIILGGDDYSEEYYDINTQGKYVIHMLEKLQKINDKVPVYMLSQTIGPYTGKRKEVALNVFNKIHIYSRDAKNYDYLVNDIKCNNIKKMYDLAFLDLHLQSQMSDEILTKYKLKKEDYIILVGTGLMNHYTNNYDDMIDKINKLLNELFAKYPGKKIVWLSHVVGCHAPDEEMLKNIKVSTKNKKRFVAITETLLPVEARKILGSAYFTISCRMHAAVSSYQMGKVCICLSYSPKFSGVIGKEFNMQDFVLETKGIKKWQDEKVVSDVIKLTDLIDKNNKILNKKINSRVTEIQEENKKVLKKLVKEMEKSIHD